VNTTATGRAPAAANRADPEAAGPPRRRRALRTRRDPVVAHRQGPEPKSRELKSLDTFWPFRICPRVLTTPTNCTRTPRFAGWPAFRAARCCRRTD